MLKHIVRASLLVIALATLPSMAAGRDYLEKGSYPVEGDYGKYLKRILAPAFGQNVVFSVMHMPPSQQESIAGILRAGDGYRAFTIGPSFQIWEAVHDEKEQLPKIRAHYRDAPLNDHVVTRIRELAAAVLQNRSNYGSKRGLIYGDSSIFIFFITSPSGQRFSANTHEIDRGTKAGELAMISDHLYRYVLGQISQKAVEDRVQRAAAMIVPRR